MSSTGSPKREDQRDPITDQIVTAVAETEGIDVLELPPLWDVIDPVALEALFEPLKSGRSRARTGSVSFEYCGYEVTVDCGQSVTVSLEQ